MRNSIDESATDMKKPDYIGLFLCVTA